MEVQPAQKLTVQPEKRILNQGQVSKKHDRNISFGVHSGDPLMQTLQMT